MHYYKRNIGDYHKKAGRLSILQHGAYTLLIDACYDREIFPTLDDAIDWVWASSDPEVDAVKFVLKKFFVECDGLFIQNRIQEDLDTYHANSATNKRIAIERERKKRLTNGKDKSTKRERTVNDMANLSNESAPNQEPLTTNQEPLTNKVTKKIVTGVPKFNFKNDLLKLGVCHEFLNDWLQIRKLKRASNTKTAFNLLINEAKKANISVNKAVEYSANENWAGFKAVWFFNKGNSENQNKDINAISTNFDAPEDWNDEQFNI